MVWATDHMPEMSHPDGYAALSVPSSKEQGRIETGAQLLR